MLDLLSVEMSKGEGKLNGIGPLGKVFMQLEFLEDMVKRQMGAYQSLNEAGTVCEQQLIGGHVVTLSVFERTVTNQARLSDCA